MKKLKMIVTSVIVLAIVGSAFTFKTKSGTFCVLTIPPDGTTSTQCTTFKQNFMITNGTPNYKYYPTWDSDPAKCNVAGNAKCTAEFRLITD